MEKGPDAFRTISEVAEDLDLPQHVLRFWETRFPQIRPLKRGGGRRYYRPDDIELLRGIRHLLYSEGYTIRGVQRILKEEGPRYVQAIWRDVEAAAMEEVAFEEDDAERLAHDPVDAGHPGRGRDDEPPRGGALTGLLNLLPSRPREAEPELSARRGSKRRGGDSEPDYLELPLLPDLAPQNRPPRDMPERTAVERAPAPVDVPPPEARQEPRSAFPFRAVAPETAPEADEDFADDYTEDYTPEPVRAEVASPETAPRPMQLRPVDDPLESAASGLSADQVQRLKATLYELQECRRLLDAARSRND
ncbi:MerR family transcriptional regulator [Ancylobacter pratisalsi]|uniref:MerR family transcriptional regulator n=1 Tax=Ancylobacter pratisalsi TaxID=1745854 RepID=UPI003CCD0865